MPFSPYNTRAEGHFELWPMFLSYQDKKEPLFQGLFLCPFLSQFDHQKQPAAGEAQAEIFPRVRRLLRFPVGLIGRLLLLPLLRPDS